MSVLTAIKLAKYTVEALTGGKINAKGISPSYCYGDEKWVHYNNPNQSEAENHGDCPVAILLRQHLGQMNIHGSKVMLCVCWDQLGSDETITGERYRTQLMRLSRAQEKRNKRPQYNERHDKVVILQHDNAILDVALSADFHLTRLSQWHTAWPTGTSSRVKSEVKNWIDSWIL
nr:transposase [Hymenolepis microstoma]